MIRESAYDETTSYNGDLQAYAATLPLLNRLLVSVMVVDRLPGSFDSPGERVLRYPGALVTNPNGDFTVLVPLVAYNYQGVIDGYQCSGETIVEWVAPVEEIVADHDEDSSTPSVGPFSLDLSPTLPSFSPGTVAIRINYPTQATTLINRTDLPPAKNPQGQRGQVLVMADDSLLPDGDTGCYQLTIPNSPTANVSTPQGGRYGLGSLPVLKGQVRPYRKVMTFQAIYRREVFR